MNVEQLNALERAVEPLSAAAAGLLSQEHAVAYNDLVLRLRERIRQALDSVALGKGVDPGLKLELWLLAKALPDARRRAEAAVEAERITTGEWAALARAASK